MSPLSNVQFNQVGQHEIAKLLMFGSDGRLEVTWPESDDERRDLETHLKQRFGTSLAIQIKLASTLRRWRRADILTIRFDAKPERLIDHPLFYYVFGCMDVVAMALRDPIFLVPSAKVHPLAGRPLRGGIVSLTFNGSMAAASKDRWHPYACAPRDLGKRVEQLLEQAAAEPLLGTPTGHALAGLPDLAWVGRTRAA